MAFTKDRADRLSASFALFRPRLDALTTEFTRGLSGSLPDAADAFGQLFDRHADRFATEVERLGTAMPDVRAAEDALRALGATLADRGVGPDRYPLIRDVWLASMERVGDYAWTDRLEADWSAALNAMAAVMAEGARSARNRAA
jgi:hemoglobin-like flavoprotein